jgi:hypothetical protein
MLKTTAFLHGSITKENLSILLIKKGLFLLSSDDAIIIMKSISSSYGSCLGWWITFLSQLMPNSAAFPRRTRLNLNPTQPRDSAVLISITCCCTGMYRYTKSWRHCKYRRKELRTAYIAVRCSGESSHPASMFICKRVCVCVCVCVCVWSLCVDCVCLCMYAVQI